MPIVQDQLTAQETGITFEDINNEQVDRILHNGSDFITCKFTNHEDLPIITYYTTDGDKAASYTVNRSNIFDLAYEKYTGNYFQLRHVLDHSAVESGKNYYITSWNDDFTSSGDSSYRWTYSGQYNYNTIDDRFEFFGNTVTGTIGKGSIKSNFRLSGNPIQVDYNFPWFTTQNDGLYNNSTVYLEMENNSRGVKRTELIHGATTMSGGIQFFINTSDTRTSTLANIFDLTLSEQQTKYILDNYCLTPSGSRELDVVVSAAHVTTIGPQTFVDVLNVYQNNSLYTSITGVQVSYSISTNICSLLLTSTSASDVGIQAPSGSEWTAHIMLSNIPYTVESGILTNNQSQFSYFSYPTGIDEGVYSNIHSYIQQTNTLGVYIDNFLLSIGASLDDLPGLSYVNNVSYYVLELDKVNNKGEYQNTIINRLDILPSGWNTIAYSGFGSDGKILMTVDDYQGGFIKILDDMYRVNISGTYNPLTYYDESSPEIDVVSGIISKSGISSLEFNSSNISNKFLQYAEYDNNTDEVRIKTLKIVGSGAPINSSEEVFLNIPDWSESTVISGVPSGITYHPCLHGIDNNTLFYFRKAGLGELNTVLASGTNGAINGTLFSSVGANFITSNVKPGDTIKLTGTGLTGINKTTITSIPTSNSLLLSTNFGSKSSLTYSILPNATQMQFNIDQETAAFASVNVDDFSLQAGALAPDNITNIKAEVISCWGTPLLGKEVAFAVIQGDGTVAPASATTNSNGIAEVQYYVGNVAGQVKVQATITD